MSSVPQMNEDNRKLTSVISLLDFEMLRELAGSDILEAVEKYYEKDDRNELAKLVIDKFGEDLIYEKKIRSGIIDSINQDKAISICKELNIGLENDFESWRKLKKRYESANEKKLREFLNIFSLPEKGLIKEKIIDDSSPMIVSMSPKFGDDISSKGVLHPYQINVKDQVAKLVHDQQRRIIVQMPTGAGKTMTALEQVVDFVRAHTFEGYIIWIVDSSELAEQAFNSFNSLWMLRGDRPTNLYRFFGRYNNEFNESKPHGLVFTTFAKCMPAAKNTDSKIFNNLCKKSKCVIVDEAHHSSATEYSQIIRKLIQYDATLIGLTATPTRSDPIETRELLSIYGSNLIQITKNGEQLDNPIKYLQDEGYLAEIEMVHMDSFDEIKSNNEKEINKNLMLSSKRNKLIVDEIKACIENKESTIIFACTVDHVIALNAICRKEKLNVDFIIGKVSRVKREEIFKRFKEKETYVILNHEILSTGIDLPKVDKLIITRPIGSQVLYEQIIGRALRGPKNGGNEKNIILNIKDNLLNYTNLLT